MASTQGLISVSVRARFLPATLIKTTSPGGHQNYSRSHPDSVVAPHEARARIALLEVLGRRSAYPGMADQHEHPEPAIRDRRWSAPGALAPANH